MGHDESSNPTIIMCEIKSQCIALQISIIRQHIT